MPLWIVSLFLIALLVFRLTGSKSDPEYALLHTVDGQAVTYSSCRPVPVAVYPAGGPPDAEALVREAVDRLRAASGLDIVITGVFGGHAPNWNFEDAPIRPDDPISISWQDGDAIAELTDDVAGMGGSFILSGSNGTKHLGSGTIALSREYFAKLAKQDDHGAAISVVLHEFGHVLGLGHVDSRRELMYSSVTDRSTFGPGDLEGLRIVGHGPCS